MSTTDLYADLIRRAEACEMEAEKWGDDPDAALDRTKARAYRHAAELLRGAVAAAVVEEREACARVADRADAALREAERIDRAMYTSARRSAAGIADAIRARGESPRGDAASGGREGAE